MMKPSTNYSQEAFAFTSKKNIFKLVLHLLRVVGEKRLISVCESVARVAIASIWLRSHRNVLFYFAHSRIIHRTSARSSVRFLALASTLNFKADDGFVREQLIARAKKTQGENSDPQVLKGGNDTTVCCPSGEK